MQTLDALIGDADGEFVFEGEDDVDAVEGIDFKVVEGAVQGDFVGRDALGLRYPTRIVLQSHNATHTLEMEVQEIFFNQQIDDTKFNVPLPEGQKVQDLDRALKRSGNLWE